MHDLVIEGATIVDGSGAPPRSGDVAVSSGRIAEIDDRRRITSAARRRIDGEGA